MNKKISISLVASFFIATNSHADTQNIEMIEISSATKSTQFIKDVTSNVAVITGSEIEAKHITTLAEALNLISGVSFTSNGGIGKSTSLNLRGFDSQRVLVLIDGVRYNDPTSISGAQFENIILDNIQQIEVIKGAQSGIWGSEASAGVINIITKKPKDGVSGTLSAEEGSFKSRKYGALLDYRADKIYGQISHNKLTTDGFSAYAKRGENIDKYEDDGYKNQTTNIKAGYKFNDNNRLDLSHTIIDASNEFDNFNSDSLINHSTSKTNIDSANFQNKNEFATTDLSYSKSDFSRKYYYPTSTSIFDGNVDEFGIKSKINYRQDDFAVVGVDYKKFEQKDTINRDYSDKSLFATNSNKFDKLVINESIRADKYDAFDDKTTGKIGVKYNFNNDIALSSNYGTGYNIPTLYQLYSQYGSVNLKPETTKSFDIGLEYNGFKATYFNNKITDLIDYDRTTNKYNNIDGTSKLKGYELEYKKDITKDILLSMSYTNLSAKDKDGKDLARRAKENLKFGVDYYANSKLTLGLNGEYVGERFDDAAKTKQTGKYTVANANIGYNISKMFSAYLKIENITDKYYQTIDGYATSPRAYYVGIKATF